MRAPGRGPLAWAAWAVILSIMIATLAALAFAKLTSKLASPCETIDAETVTRETVTELRSEGWYAVSGDGKEALYSPACAPGSGHE